VKHEDVKHEEGDVAAGALSFAEWELCVPVLLKGDTLWLIEAYRLSLYLGDVGWVDSNSLIGQPRMRFVADQLGRATAKISACIAEGYSRNTGKGRAIYYEYALGPPGNRATGITKPERHYNRRLFRMVYRFARRSSA
jgi:hypothetical protein